MTAPRLASILARPEIPGYTGAAGCSVATPCQHCYARLQWKLVGRTMTRILGIFCACAAALAVVGCDDIGRKYPPGYTDDGVRIAEDGWRYLASDKWAMISYFPTTGRAQVTLRCNLPEDNSAIGQMLNLDRLEITTGEFEPQQQWPQPPLEIAMGRTTASQLATLDPWEDGNPNMTIKVDGRTRNQLLHGVYRGLPITLAFADQTRDIPGPPQSMRVAFATKCRGKG